MFWKKPGLTPLELRKRLLVAESDLNRAQLRADWQAMSGEVRGLAGRVKSAGSLASTAALLVAGVAALRRGKPASAAARPSRLQTILKGAGMVSTLWLAFRAHAKSRAPANNGDHWRA